jgi:plastocyanin
MKSCIPCVGLMALCLSAAVMYGNGRDRDERCGETFESSLMQAADQASEDHSTTTEKPAKKVNVIQARIENFTFRPERLTIAPGTRVTWINNDDVPHTVTANGKAFNSGTLDTGDKFSFVFDKPGTYSYFCAVHRHMTGTVVVNPAGK